MSKIATAGTWNVLTTDWLDVMEQDARCSRVSVLDALRRSSEITQIVAPSPLDLFAVYRFLMTLLYWKAEECGGLVKLREALLADRVPRTLVPALKAEEGLFNLFDTRRPFLQDPAVKDAKDLPPSSLFAEMASGTNVAHFHHADDGTSRLCLRCATLGLLRLAPWTQSGGAGKQPSLHGAPPIMALAWGRSLAETLGLNLVPLDIPHGKPQWSGQFKPAGKKKGVELMEGLTWNPRRVHLRSPLEPSLCCQCGESRTPVVGQIAFEKNPACKQEEDALQEWRDPAAFYKAEDHRTAKSSRESDAAVGDDLRRLYEQHFGKKVEPAPVSALVALNPKHSAWLVVMPCTNPANNKSYDHRLEFVRGFSGDAPSRAGRWTDQMIWRAGDDRLLQPYRISTPTSGMRRFVAAAAQLDGSSWAVLANAACRGMDEDPAAFDVFTGIYWPLRNKHTTLPSRGAAWMSLKLMATAGAARPSPGNCGGSFRPWEKINPAASPAKRNLYRRAIPAGQHLENELREIIRHAVAGSVSTRIAWAGLCQFLHEVTP